MNASQVQRLLQECGFRNVLWPAPLGQLWGVVGELDGGTRIVVTCMPHGKSFRLHVSPAALREWLGEQLAQNGAPDVRVTGEPIIEQRDPHGRTPWITLTLGVGAIALFTWVISSIVR